MSLIEKLGGYANSKGVLEAYKKNGWSISDVCKGFHQYFTIEDLEKATLQYRRANNIFEVGDFIVKAARLKDGDLYRIGEIAESKNYIKTGCGIFIDTPMFRHATNEEIKAGRRI